MTIFIGGSRRLSFFYSGMPCLKSHKFKSRECRAAGIGKDYGAVRLCSKENMGKPNNVLKEYMKKPERVRSVLEYYLREKLPNNWEIEAGDGFYSARNSMGKVSFRERDGIRRVHAGGSAFWLGLENQEPVLNLTLYWGKEEWKRPLTLEDMMERRGLPEKLWELFGDYKVHLIPMRQIPEEDLQKMDSDLRYVLGIMKCAGSRKRYIEYIKENKDFFGRVPRSALDVIDVCGGIGGIRKYLEFTLNQVTGEEETDMCKAVRDIERYAELKGKKEGMKQGRKEGKKEGRKEGRKEGIEQGRKEGMELGAFEMLCSLVRDGLLQLSEAAAKMNLSEGAFQEKMRCQYLYKSENVI